MQYIPHSIQSDKIALSKELTDVIEEISENVHETWVNGRISEGWRCGEKYSAEDKTHPSLVPYPELPEGEKEYDRRTVTQTIQSLLDRGFKIEK